ncbi:MAG TPA: hypothetical protein VGM78_03635 [Ilumatobacteraceae bacterium]|jgi:hypothetical protein
MTSAARQVQGSAEVIPLERGDARRSPLETVLRFATEPARRASGQPTVDVWGRDGRLVSRFAPIAHLRWDISVGGEQHLPAGPALVVVNTRRFALTPLTTAMALGDALDRPVRFAGRPDTAPVGSLLRRLGGILAAPSEIASALRGGDIVVVAAAPTIDPRRVGRVDESLIVAAVREHAPIHIAATLSSAIGRDARVEVAPALVPRHARRGPLAEIEIAEQAQRDLHALLDELGGTRIGVPGLGWIGVG